MKVLLTITLIVGHFGPMALFGQSLRYPVSLPYLNLCAFSKQQQDPFSFTANQAALAGEKQKSIGLYSERRFMLEATSAYRLVADWPSSMGNFGLQMDYGGFRNFNENKIGLAYARNLGAGLAVGIQFNYYGYRIPAYGSASTLNVEAGAIIHFTDQLNGGFHIYNPMGSRLGKSPGEKLASSYSMGLGYDASPDFFAGAELVKEEDRPVNVIAGVQYHFEKIFFARMGIESETGAVYAGTGVGWRDLRLDLSASYHPQLGFSPGILMMIRF